MTDTIAKIIKDAFDLHIHIGPEVIPRKFTAQSLPRQEAGRLRGAVLKNHFYSTVPGAIEASTGELELFGGIVLNRPVGGLNPDAVRAAAQLSEKPIVVWLPTISAENFLSKSKYEIPPEWIGKAGFKARLSSQIEGISLLDDTGSLRPQVVAVLNVIRDFKAVLATGHISPRETVAVATEARKLGIRSVIVTHPIYQRTRLTIQQQRSLAKIGCYMEQCYSMIAIDDIPVEKVVQQIRAIGPDAIILSSDVGQQFSPAPSVALKRFAKLLVEEGIPLQWIRTMLVTNPQSILKSDKESM
jgi:hypothetical protein